MSINSGIVHVQSPKKSPSSVKNTLYNPALITQAGLEVLTRDLSVIVMRQLAVGMPEYDALFYHEDSMDRLYLLPHMLTFLINPVAAYMIIFTAYSGTSQNLT